MPAELRLRIRSELRNRPRGEDHWWSWAFGALAAAVAASILIAAAVSARPVNPALDAVARNLKPCGEPAAVERWLGVRLNTGGPIELVATGESDYLGRRWKVLQFRADGRQAMLLSTPAPGEQPVADMKDGHARHWTSGGREYLLVAENRQACLLCHESLI
jgi:hypothetical protein